VSSSDARTTISSAIVKVGWSLTGAVVVIVSPRREP